MHLPLAFSIHHFVSSVGADAGFAAIVGLAILVLLYFAQARETSSLRDQSVSASERVAELERRLAQLGSATVSAASPPEASEQPEQADVIPAAPAGVAAPALASATHLIPLLSRAAPRLAPAPTPALARPVAAAVSGSAAAAASPPPPVTPPPATVAALGGGASPVAPPAPVPAAAPSASNGTGEHTIARPATVAAAQPRRVQIRPGAGYSPPPPPLRPGARRAGSRRWVPIVIAVVLAGVGVAALLIVTSSGGNSKAPAAGSTTNAPVPRTKAAFKPSSVTVAVLNGTDVSHLAARVALKLQHAGYKQGDVATAADQTHQATAVGYVGTHHHAAIEVARALGLSSTSVAPADQSAKAVACPPPSACGAQVIVTIGSDLSNTP